MARANRAGLLLNRPFVVALARVATLASAQPYPSKPGRLVGREIAERLDQPAKYLADQPALRTRLAHAAAIAPE